VLRIKRGFMMLRSNGRLRVLLGMLLAICSSLYSHSVVAEHFGTSQMPAVHSLRSHHPRMVDRILEHANIVQAYDANPGSIAVEEYVKARGALTHLILPWGTASHLLEQPPTQKDYAAWQLISPFTPIRSIDGQSSHPQMTTPAYLELSRLLSNGLILTGNSFAEQLFSINNTRGIHADHQVLLSHAKDLALALDLSAERFDMMLNQVGLPTDDPPEFSAVREWTTPRELEWLTELRQVLARKDDVLADLDIPIPGEQIATDIVVNFAKYQELISRATYGKATNVPSVLAIRDAARTLAPSDLQYRFETAIRDSYTTAPPDTSRKRLAEIMLLAAGHSSESLDASTLSAAINLHEAIEMTHAQRYTAKEGDQLIRSKSKRLGSDLTTAGGRTNYLKRYAVEALTRQIPPLQKLKAKLLEELGVSSLESWQPAKGDSGQREYESLFPSGKKAGKIYKMSVQEDVADKINIEELLESAKGAINDALAALSQDEEIDDDLRSQLKLTQFSFGLRYTINNNKVNRYVFDPIATGPSVGLNGAVKLTSTNVTHVLPGQDDNKRHVFKRDFPRYVAEKLAFQAARHTKFVEGKGKSEQIAVLITDTVLQQVEGSSADAETLAEVAPKINERLKEIATYYAAQALEGKDATRRDKFVALLQSGLAGITTTLEKHSLADSDDVVKESTSEEIIISLLSLNDAPVQEVRKRNR